MPHRLFSALRTALGTSTPVEAKSPRPSANPDLVSVDLRDIRSGVEALRGSNPAVHGRQQAWLESLARRLDAPGLAPAARQALMAETRLLDLETRVASKQIGPFEPGAKAAKGADGLMRARREFGEALLRQLDQGGDERHAFHQHLGRLHAEDLPARDAVLLALDALPELRYPDDPSKRKQKQQAPQPTLAALLCVDLARAAQPGYAAKGASTAPREAPRMPNDVLVHLSCTITDALRRHPGDPSLSALGAKAQRVFLAHEVNAAMVRKMAGDAAGRLFQLKEHQASRQCLQLVGQLPARSMPVSASQHRLQLHDNLYGRVFDSLFAADLVKRSPPAMLAAVGKMGQMFERQLEDSPVNRAAAESQRASLLHHPRAWQALTKGCRAFLDAPPGAALDRLKRFLSSTPQAGPQAMAQLYLMTYLGLHQRAQVTAWGRPEDVPRYLQACAATHGVFRAQALRDAPAVEETRVRTRDTGILLAHQPAATADSRLQATNRPATGYRIGHRLDSATASRAESTAFSPTLDQQLSRGVPVGSGVSGSTHMLLHLYADLRDRGMTDVSARDVLLACATLMNYDGGHSLHEALWSGNLLDEKLGLGLALSDASTSPEAFIAGHDAFIRGFDDQTRDRLQAATDRAWAGTQDYLRMHSHFAWTERPGGGA